VLPSELLRASYWRGNIRLKYSGFSAADLQAAEAVIRAYAENVGRKRAWIRERILELEDLYGFKFVRGLALLVERKCVFASQARINPLEARHAVFAEAAKNGLPATWMARRRMLEAAAERLGVSAEQLDEWLYADLDAEATLELAAEVKPLELLKLYNLSLTQTLLFMATELSFNAAGNWQRIFRAVKHYGLMYSVTRQHSHFSVKVEGPTSLFKLTRRYGTCLAKVLPEIMHAPAWIIEAKILRNNRLFTFSLDNGKHGWLFPAVASSEGFDSKVEEEFAAKFRSLGLAWTLQREPEPLQAGVSVLIPDFVFTLGSARVYMEVVGFWTHEYLRRKLAKLAEVRDTPLIVAVDEELACGKLTELKSTNPHLHLIRYKNSIPLHAVLQVLAAYAEETVQTQAAQLKLELTKAIVPLKELAAEHGVTVEAARRAASSMDTHVLIGETLVAKTLMETVKQQLENNVKGEAPLLTVLTLLEPYQFPEPLAILVHCGFQVKWRGLLPADATVARATVHDFGIS